VKPWTMMRDFSLMRMAMFCVSVVSGGQAGR
jgi:hypothetical protein